MSKIRAEKNREHEITTAMEEGERLRLSGDWKKAEACYRKALIASEHKNDRARFEMLRAGAHALLTRRKYDDAEKKFREALAVPGYEQDNDTRFSYYLAYGQQLLHGKQYEKAAKIFQNALDVPGHADDKMAILLRRIALERQNRVNALPIIQ